MRWSTSILSVLVASAAFAQGIPPGDEFDLASDPSSPEVQVRVLGAGIGNPVGRADISPVMGVRAGVAEGAFGLQSGYESSLDDRRYEALDAHLLLRAPELDVIEGALAMGYRRLVFGDVVRNGFELGLPHHYVLSRLEGKPLAIEVLPAAFFASKGVDFRLEAGLSVPVGAFSFQVGGRAFSFDHEVRGGGYLSVGVGI
jgi:hypothetical protein